MNRVRNKPATPSKLVAIAIIILVALYSGHALQTILTSPEQPLLVATVICVGVLLTRPNIFRIDAPKGTLYIFVLMILFTFLTVLGGNLWFYIMLLCTIVIAYTVTECFSFESAVDCYLKVMTAVSVVSLVGYVLLNFTGLLNSLPIMENRNDVQYGVGVIFNYIVDTPDRNCGMFWEPGLFATHLSIATVFEMLRPRRTNIWRIILFSASLFTANSSAGFVLWFLCMLLFVVKNRKQKTGVLLGAVYCVLIGAALVFVMNFDKVLSMTSLGGNEYLSKLSTDSLMDSSRLNAITHNLSIFASSPVFGAGILSVTENMAYVADTSTSTYLLSIFGIPAIAYTFYWIKGAFNLKDVNFFVKLLVAIIALIIVNKEPHHLNLFSWCILFYLQKTSSSFVKQSPLKTVKGGSDCEYTSAAEG